VERLCSSPPFLTSTLPRIRTVRRGASKGRSAARRRHFGVTLNRINRPGGVSVFLFRCFNGPLG